jgi:hypothetical protein
MAEVKPVEAPKLQKPWSKKEFLEAKKAAANKKVGGSK